MALRTDSGGPGEFRGGLGCVREFEFLTDEVRLTHRGERHYYGASGSQGGEAGACSESIILRANGDEETVPSKLLTTMNRGDRLLLKTAGGGGYGSPERISHEGRAPEYPSDGRRRWSRQQRATHVKHLTVVAGAPNQRLKGAPQLSRWLPAGSEGLPPVQSSFA